MASPAQNSIFSSAAPPRDKADEITRAVRTILNAEVAAREAKTAKLRELRLQREAGEAPAPAGKPARKKSRPARP